MVMEVTEGAILDLVGEESFKKGLAYYLTGSVTKYEELDGVIKAKVIGSKEYVVEINTWDLSVRCDCPAIFYQEYCKHVVAVLLTNAKGVISPTLQSAKPIKSRTQKTSMAGVRAINSSKSPKEITAKIKGEWNKLKHKFGYRTYWDGQEDFADYLHDHQFDYPTTYGGFEDMMNLAFWLGDHFDADDSNGVLQDAIYELVVESVKNMEVDYRGLPVKYLSRDCEIEVAGYLVSAMFTELTNQKIIDDLIIYVNQGLNDPGDSTLLYTLAQYYIDKKLEAKMDFLFGRYPDELANMYLDFLFNIKKSAIIVKKLWAYRDKFGVSAEKIIWALRKEGESSKLLEYYSGIFLRDEVSSASIQKLREYCKLANKDGYFDILLAKKKEAVRDSHDLENILMYERNYDEVADRRIARFKNNTYISKADYDEIDAFGEKMLILDKKTGIKLFDFLVQDQMEKLARSNHYDRIREYLYKLIDLGQLDKVEKNISEGIKKYPTKKALIEILNGARGTSARTSF